MTLFSYIVSNILNKQFREPVLLNKLLRRARFAQSHTIHPISGWILHYAVGVVLIIIYHFIWILIPLELTYINAIVLGLASGFLAVA